MTRSMAIAELQDEDAVEALDDDEMAAPILAAIQHSFEEAMASIDDLARAPWIEPPPPGTEKIDLRRVTLPAVPVVPTPPTEAMSLAARALAEHPVEDRASPSTTASVSGSRGQEDAPEPAAPRRRRPRWWRP